MSGEVLGIFFVDAELRLGVGSARHDLKNSSLALLALSVSVTCLSEANFRLSFRPRYFTGEKTLAA